ncbi:unnamed protein product [Periconia digitata]|uniref:Uncharacterized protein n=1 Tax=Periconia digitata TaxID=1303443 RepID=A0A9W4UMT5_9PLEO|nr:unnamed protein product [Periconia digitata]
MYKYLHMYVCQSMKNPACQPEKVAKHKMRKEPCVTWVPGRKLLPPSHCHVPVLGSEHWKESPLFLLPDYPQNSCGHPAFDTRYCQHTPRAVQTMMTDKTISQEYLHGFIDDCKGLLSEAYDATTSHEGLFPMEKPTCIFKNNVTSIALVGQLCAHITPTSTPNLKGANVRLDDVAKSQFNKLARLGVRRCGRLWLTNEYYILCTFVKLSSNGTDVWTNIPVEDGRMDKMDQFIDTRHAPLNLEPPSDAAEFLYYEY